MEKRKQAMNCFLFFYSSLRSADLYCEKIRGISVDVCSCTIAHLHDLFSAFDALQLVNACDSGSGG
ncbi:hypothetical protein CLOSTMETH_02245 [[Clostridium] methylpentosum DSM 5476]|uniref:Uncharacterized protein n=1 Tax=[Clostridium] methylpentosum DSM 5476 TaxID=537013 RepID=C0EEF9_9FIRM|nr:hypothetical protein CLOSTMETH_02245 [[Clostridium] methylpentosum DSM 5476]